MSNLSSKILNQIKEKNVTPKSRQYFILMHGLLWIALGASVFLGSIACAIVLRHLASADWEMMYIATGNHMRSFVFFLPYLWIIFIGITLLIADKLFKNTQKGHRLAPWKVVLASILISILFGALIFSIRADESVEETLRENIKPYAEWQEFRQKPFNTPERGLLVGRIIEMNPDEAWMVIDFMDNEWVVDTTMATFYNNFQPRLGQAVGMKGNKLDEIHFEALQITPWKVVQIKMKEELPKPRIKPEDRERMNYLSN